MEVANDAALGGGEDYLIRLSERIFKKKKQTFLVFCTGTTVCVFAYINVIISLMLFVKRKRLEIVSIISF